MKNHSKRKSRKQKKDGVCVYYFAHRGLGKMTQETDDIKSASKMLKNDCDNYHVSCARTKAQAQKKYSNSVKRAAEKRKSKRKSPKKSKAVRKSPKKSKAVRKSPKKKRLYK